MFNRKMLFLLFIINNNSNELCYSIECNNNFMFLSYLHCYCYDLRHFSPANEKVKIIDF